MNHFYPGRRRKNIKKYIETCLLFGFFRAICFCATNIPIPSSCVQNRFNPHASLHHFGTRRPRGAVRARSGGCFLRQRAGTSSRRRIRPWDWAVRSKDLPRGVSSSRDAVSDQEDDVLSFEEFEKALLPPAPSRDGWNRGADGAVVSAGAATGINWRLLVEDILVQPLFFGIFAVLAKPAICESGMLHIAVMGSVGASGATGLTIKSRSR